MVVIPTRNRADLAQRALASVLAQEPACKVLVSDNSTDSAQREPLAAACAAAGGRVRYVCPPAPIPMAPHWEWARKAAQEDTRATHLTYLTDRMVFLPGALADLHAAAAAFPDEAISGYEDVVEDHRRPVRVTRHPCSNELVRVRSEHLLALVRHGQLAVGLPRMLNTIAPRTLLDAIEDRFGTVFDSIAPDFCFTFKTLVVADTCVVWDRSLRLHSGLDRSNGRAQMRGIASADSRDFDAETGAAGFAPATPLPGVATICNAALNEYFEVMRSSRDPRLRPIPAHHYLGRLAEDTPLLEDPSLRSATEAQLRDAGWGPWPRVKRLASFAGRLVSFYAQRPSAIVAYIRDRLRTSPEPPAFETVAVAWEWALVNRRPSQSLTPELRTLLADPPTQRLSVPDRVVGAPGPAAVFESKSAAEI